MLLVTVAVEGWGGFGDDGVFRYCYMYLIKLKVLINKKQNETLPILSQSWSFAPKLM